MKSKIIIGFQQVFILENDNPNTTSRSDPITIFSWLVLLCIYTLLITIEI